MPPLGLDRRTAALTGRCEKRHGTVENGAGSCLCCELLFMWRCTQWKQDGKDAGDNSEWVSANQIAMTVSLRHVNSVKMGRWR